MEKKKKKTTKKITKKITKRKSLYFFLFLLLLNVGLLGLNLVKAKGLLIPSEPLPEIKEKTIDLNKMTLKQKIAQMLIVPGKKYNLKVWKKIGVGGIHLFALKDKKTYQETIQKFQEGMEIPFLVTVDLEGCWNPFANFQKFKANNEIKNVGEAYQKGYEEGKFLKELGFTINFAPVVDLEDKIWGCRSFSGDEKKTSELAEAYLLGLQSQGIFGVAKHYPGKTLVVKDPHKSLVITKIEKKDIYPYLYLKKKGVLKGVMVSHIISYGEVDSQEKPATVSPVVIKKLKSNFSGLIIADEINMLGLKNFYKKIEEQYIDLFKAGSDLILNFNEDPLETYHLIKTIEKAIKEGVISEERINQAVKKILELKGFKVIS